MFKSCLYALSKKVFDSQKRYSTQQSWGILGVPFDMGQLRKGVGQGPQALRESGLLEQLKTIDSLDVKDFGDIVYHPENENHEKVENMQSLEHVAACTKLVSESVANILTSGRRCLTIGGDHSIGVGTIDGHVRALGSDIAILWVDAHADLNTNATSPSGNVHGMSMALLARELSDYWPYLPGMDWQKPLLSIRNVAYIGLRSVDSYERLVIDKFGITAFGMEDIEQYGIHAVIKMALDRIDPNQHRSLHVSFDIDALDSLEAPSTGTAVRGGLTLRESIYIMETVHKTGRLVAMDLVEVNPSIGSKQDASITVDAAKHLIMAAFGHSRRGMGPKDIYDLPLQTFPNK